VQPGNDKQKDDPTTRAVPGSAHAERGASEDNYAVTPDGSSVPPPPIQPPQGVPWPAFGGQPVNPPPTGPPQPWSSHNVPGASSPRMPAAHYGEIPPIEQFPCDNYSSSQNPAPTGGSKNNVTVFALAGVALVTVGVAVASMLISNRSAAESEAGSAQPTMVSALTSESSPTTTPTPTGEVSDIPPAIPGYQAVSVPKRKAAYDVPRNWEVASEGTLAGFGAPPDAIAGSGAATDGRNYCDNSNRTVTFVTGSDIPDAATAATRLGRDVARLGYSVEEDVESDEPEPLTSTDHSQHGMLAQTRGTVPDPKPGCASTFSVYTFAIPSQNGSVVLVLTADTGVPDAVDPATATSILGSVRPL